jgi:hypothetical protein
MSKSELLPPDKPRMTHTPVHELTELEKLYKDLHRIFIITMIIALGVIIAIAVKALFFQS